MTIASEITRINTNIANAYTACNSKGATMPVTQNSANLATCINSISGGAGNLQSKTLEVSSATPTISTVTPDSGYDGLSSVTVDMTYIEDRLDTVLGSSVVPTGTINITENGTYDVTNYANANVNVSGGGGIGITREVSANGVFQIPASNFTFSLPSNATDIGDYAMYDAFRYSTGLTSLDLSSLTTVSGYQAMYCAFQNCTSLTNADLSNLTTVSGSSAMSFVFQNCTSLTSVNLSSLTTVSSSYAMRTAFASTKLTILSFPSLTSTSFGSYTNQFSGMLSGVTGCTVHFPSNLQSVIGSWSSVMAGFSGTNTTVLFDLPATT